MLFLDGVYLTGGEQPVFRRLPAPRPQALEGLIHTISQRVGCGAYLEREGQLVRDIENSYLQLEAPEESAINDLLGHSITYRIAVGSQAGRKAFALQTVPAREEHRDNSQLAKTASFSLHAGVAAKAHQRRKLERLCRYIARPAVATDRLALIPQDNVRYTLKIPYRDSTTHIILKRLDFIPRLAALVPKPRVNLTRFQGGFAPTSTLRHHVTPVGRGKRRFDETKTPAQRRAAMTWAQRLKRVFKIDIETCDQCGGTVKVIACIEHPAVVKRILDYLEQRPESNATPTHPARAPPAADQRDGS